MTRWGLGAVLLAFAPTSAANCFADVEVTSARAQKRTAFVSFRVSHDAGNGELASIYFDYKINYVHAKTGNALVERGVVNELVRGPTETMTKQDTTGLDIGDIISVDVSNIKCRD